MKKKSLSVAFLSLLFLQEAWAMSFCTTDADCDSAHGYCINSYCSCNSGFGGNTCNDRPDPACDGTYESVSSSQSEFSTSATISYNYPNLVMQFQANLDEGLFQFPSFNDTINTSPHATFTSIIFGDGSFTDCAFPNGGSNGVAWSQLAAASGSCYDTYTATLSWEDAKSKCGFSDPSDTKTYSQTAYITRTYILADLRGNTVTRTETSEHTLSVM